MSDTLVPEQHTILAASTRLIKKALADSARAWRLPPKIVVFIWLLPLIIASMGPVAALLGKDAYKWLTAEDGFAETVQIFFYSIALVLGLIIAVRQWRRGEKLIAFLYLVLCFGLLFLIGEELSWGQRLFGWESSATFADFNKQQETNLHNIYGVGSTFKWVQLVVGAYGTILPLVVLRWNVPDRFEELAASIIPHYSLILYFLPLFIWRIFRNLVEVPDDLYFVVAEYNEVLELVLAIGLFLFMIFQIRRLASRGEISTREPSTITKSV